MSDDFIRIIPTEVSWQPTRAAAKAAAAFVAELFDGPSDSADEVSMEYFDAVTLIDAGVNTSEVTCPICGRGIDLDWVYGTIEERHHDLATLDVVVPCCASGGSVESHESARRAA